MVLFIARRLAWAVVLMAVITFITFVIFVLIPAPPLPGQRILDNELKVQLNLSGRSLPSAYVHYVDRIALHGDLGYSNREGDSVVHVIEKTLPVTASLVIGGVLFWLMLAFPVGILSALRPRSLLDKGLMVFVLIGIAGHPVWVGLMLSYFLGFKAGLFPVSGYCDFHAHPETGNCGGAVNWAHHLVLPWISFGLLYAALYARMIRASVIEAMNEDYVRTARAKGAGTNRVLRKHVLPNAMLPVVSMLGMDLALAFSATLFIEVVFSLPGMGHLLYLSLGRSDRPLIMGIVLTVSIFVVVANLLVDIAYAALDPRIRLYGKRERVGGRALRKELRAQPRVKESSAT
ncbi:MAG TPA: ABC transporter permease [Gaiellaceae bacterium]|jgi:peptide/nickel transport system permease protein